MSGTTTTGRYGVLRSNGTEERLPRVIGVGSATAVVIGSMMLIGYWCVGVTKAARARLAWSNAVRDIESMVVDRNRHGADIGHFQGLEDPG